VVVVSIGVIGVYPASGYIGAGVDSGEIFGKLLISGEIEA
jgi:hypothetical protein